MHLCILCIYGNACHDHLWSDSSMTEPNYMRLRALILNSIINDIIGSSNIAITLRPTRVQDNSSATWWCHQMELFSALLALCAGNSPVTGEFLRGIHRWPVNSPHKVPVTRSFDVFLHLRLNKGLSKQSSKQSRFETPSCPLWRHYNDFERRHPASKDDTQTLIVTKHM